MIKFRIIELDENNQLKKVWYESHKIVTKKTDLFTEMESHYFGALRKLDDQYNLFHHNKNLETEISEDDGKTWDYYGDATIDYYNMLDY